MRWFAGKAYDPAAGRESRSAFIAQAAFWISAGKFLTNGMTFKLWGQTFNLGTVDAGLLGAFLVPCLALYWGRRSAHFGLSASEPTSSQVRPQGGSVG